jgi:hypothetical protein
VVNGCVLCLIDRAGMLDVLVDCNHEDQIRYEKVYVL